MISPKSLLIKCGRREINISISFLYEYLSLLLIYLQYTSPRLQYIVSFLSRFYNYKIDSTTDLNDYVSYRGSKINYSPQLISEEEVWIKPHGLLFENKIQEIEIICQKHQDGFLILFPSDDNIGFDIFSAIFFLLSRYEEYLPHKKDMYGRYAHHNSIAFRNEFLNIPLINIWLGHLKKVLEVKTGEKIVDSIFQFQPTYDIDIAWSYKNKDWLRNAGGFYKSISNLNFKEVRKRISVLTGNIKDPFDTYQWMEDLHQQYKLKPIYFFHVGLEKSVYDKNISPNNLEMQQLIKSISVKNQIGLHPSWISGDKEDALLNEKLMLEMIVDRKIISSRQHYIQLTVPETYRRLIKAGIENDYSMGYGSINGFRASIASSFYWYDLAKEEQTELLLHPFCFMDANSLYEQKQNTDETLSELDHYLSELKKVGGTFITIWHHNFFGTDTIFTGWADAYKSFLSKL